MKSRILDELYKLSIGNDSSMVDYIASENGLSKEEVAGRAEIILETILHNYSRFHIETIDRFFQRVIRAFTRELGLSATYNIEIDGERILEEAVDGLLINLDSDPAMAHWIAEFADTNIREGKNWNVKKGILSFGSQLFREEYKIMSKLLHQKLSDRSYLNQYSKELNAWLSRFEQKLKQYGQKGMQLLEENHLDDAEVVIVSYGIAARTALWPIEMARAEGIKVGMLRLITVWPFPDEYIRQLAGHARAIVVPELNMGQIALEVERCAAGKTPVTCVPHPGGGIHQPQEDFLLHLL